jgi:HSP20 family protein
MTNLIRRNHTDRDLAPHTSNPSWDPFRVMNALLGWDPWGDLAPAARLAAFSPSFDVRETPDAYLIKGDLPGVAESDLDVTVTGNVLTVAGKREDMPGADQRVYAMERGVGTFARTFSLPEGANLDELAAELKHGVLTLTIPKRPEVQPRRISIGKGPSAKA